MSELAEKSNPLDDPRRYGEIAAIIQGKPAVKVFYEKIYSWYSQCLEKVPSNGLAIEFGAGAGFVKQVIPSVVTSDIIPYAGIDLVLDVQRLSLENESVKVAFFTNVLHHVPDAEKMFEELSRVLVSRGKVLIIDQYPGWPARLIFRYAHHEPFLPEAREWRFETSGPLSGANGALAWILFFRDRKKFEMKFPLLKVVKIERHTPFYYWLSGGLKSWSLIPGFMASTILFCDQLLGKLIPGACSFMTIELEKV